MIPTQLLEGRLRKSLAQRYRLSDGRVMTLEEMIVSGNFKSKFVSVTNAVSYNRIRYNRMDNRQQKEFDEKFRAKKKEFNLRYEDGSWMKCPKIVYDWAELPETEEENYFRED